MIYFRNAVALKCGINAAIVAEIIWDLQKCEFRNGKTTYRYGSRWCRCSQPMITLICPCLSIHMAKDAVRALRETGIIKVDCFNDDKFDHTSWYTFTEYGKRLMSEGDIFYKQEGLKNGSR